MCLRKIRGSVQFASCTLPLMNVDSFSYLVILKLSISFPDAEI